MPVTKTEIFPYIFYRDVPAALEWLTRAFGLKEEMRTTPPDGGMHAEMSLGDQRIMIGETSVSGAKHEAIAQRIKHFRRVRLTDALTRRRRILATNFKRRGLDRGRSGER